MDRLFAENALGRNNPHLKPIFARAIVKGKVLSTKENYAGLVTSFLQYCDGQMIDVIDPDNSKSLNP